MTFGISDDELRILEVLGTGTHTREEIALALNAPGDYVCRLVCKMAARNMLHAVGDGSFRIASDLGTT